MATLKHKPTLGTNESGARRGSFLFVCFYDPNGLGTVQENISLWQAYSTYDLQVLNLWPGRGGYLRIPATITLADFDGVLIHSTASYFEQNLRSLDADLDIKFEDFDGVKILMKQDEQVRSAAFARFIGEKRFDLVITCLSGGELSKVYPKEVVGPCRFLHALTGYVSPAMLAFGKSENLPRTLDLTYRGSTQPLQFGRLGFEKHNIGTSVSNALVGRGLHVDVSNLWKDRIVGADWYSFLRSSRAVLGVESGSNLFDFDGSVERWCEDYVSTHADEDPLSEAYYLDAHRLFLHRFEGNVNYAQISPRHFEAAAAGAMQLLYEGEYSGIFKPYEHFFPLKRDLSNLDEAIDALRDEGARSEYVSRAFDEIIANDAFHYRKFVGEFDELTSRLVEEKGVGLKRGRAPDRAFGSNERPRVLILAAHEPVLDPRLEWFARTLVPDADICELGTYRWEKAGEGPTFERLSDARVRIRVERQRHDWSWMPGVNAEEPGVGVTTLLMLKSFLDAPKWVLTRLIGAIDYEEEDIDRFRALCGHFVNSNAGLIQAARNLGKFDVIIACDLETMPAALTMANEWGAALLYDAHEYWPYSYMDFRAWEIEFWSGIERRLVKHADRRISVSPQLSMLVQEEYGVPYGCAPNCTLLEDGDCVDFAAKDRNFAARAPKMDFLFQGAFAPGRGLEHLISAWAHVTSEARLFLRGKDAPFRTEMIELARSLGLLDVSVFFPPPVSEADLVIAASEADIGIVPYMPGNINYRFASPNKLSQYMAAGLGILANDIPFVRSVVVESGAGIAVDFSDHAAVAQAVDELTANREQVAEFSQRARKFFQEKFHWEYVARESLDWIRAEIDRRRDSERGTIDLSWVGSRTNLRQISSLGDITQAEASVQSQLDDYQPEFQSQVVVTDGWVGLSQHVARTIAEPASNAPSAREELARLRELLEADAAFYARAD